MLRLKFSLRFLLGMVAVAALIVAWLMLPTMQAWRFADAVNSGDYPRADEFLLNRAGPFPEDWRKCEEFEAAVYLGPITWGEFMSGRRHLSLGVEFFDGDCMVGDAFPLIATRRGVINVGDLVY